MGKGLKVTPVTHTIFNFALRPIRQFRDLIIFHSFIHCLQHSLASIVISIKYGGIVIVYNGFDS
jgi:hypothetical protein